MDSPRGDPPPLSGAPFIGFIVGCILYGCTVLQAYQYFMNYVHDTRFRKAFIAVVCLLDTIDLVFSAILIYLSILDPLHHPAPDLSWTLKGMATATTLLIFLVQSYYLRIIWTFAEVITVNQKLASVVRKLSLLVVSYALAVVVVFLAYLAKIDSFSDFSVAFQRMIYVGIGSVALVDTITAVVLSYLLFKASLPTRQSVKSRGVVRFLLFFFVGTGVLTAIAAIATIVTYVLRPSSVTYLAIQFARPRLYANSVLAMFNSKARLRQQMQASSELKISSKLLFGDGIENPSADGPPAEPEGSPDAA